MKKTYSNKAYIQKVEEYRKLLGNRTYRVGLDLGVGSIGYVIVGLEEYDGKTIPAEVIFCGSRIFTPSTGAAERRQKRGERNSHRHKTNRLILLWKILAEQDLALPYTAVQTEKNTLAYRFSFGFGRYAGK